MAEANSISSLPRCIARASNGTPLYQLICPICGVERVGDKRKLGKPCHPCAMKNRATHGLSNTAVYRLLKSMTARCDYPSSSSYSYYGAKGITVCQGWRSDPKAFADWAFANGYGPGMEIDRIDGAKDYCPENCQFIPHEINSQKRGNQRCNREKALEIKNLLAQGVAVKEVAKVLEIHYMVVWHINAGNTWRNA